MARSAVDVLIPVYNAERYLQAAIDSILRQTMRDIVVHVVDDGSTDGSLAVLERIARTDARVRVHVKENGGIVDALNFGLGFCTAPLIARHDADDNAYPERLERQVAALEAAPDVVAVGAAAQHIDADGRTLPTIARMSDPAGADPAAIPSVEPYLIHPFLMVRRDAVETAGGYRYVQHSEDTDLYWRLVKLGRLVNLPDVLGEYRMHADSVSARSIENGRIMAVCSQLAALSALRRAQNRADLAFDRSWLLRSSDASSLERVVEHFRPRLNEHEHAHLRLAASAKLLQLASYRPYEPTLADYDYIKEAAYGREADRAEAVRSLRERSERYALRLLRRGRVRQALALTPAWRLPPAVARKSVRAVVRSGGSAA